MMAAQRGWSVDEIASKLLEVSEIGPGESAAPCITLLPGNDPPYVLEQHEEMHRVRRGGDEIEF
jgi:hypothetical protein